MNVSTPVIILAGGFGTRLARISNGKPKSLIEVKGRPVLQHQIEMLKDKGFQDIRLSLHYRADQIIEFCERRWPGEIQFVVEPQPLGTGGAIKFASQGIRVELLVLNGDNLWSSIDFDRFLAQGANTLLSVYLDDARDFGLVHIEDGKVCQFLEKPEGKTGGYVNSGLYLLKPEIIQHTPQEVFMLELEVFPLLAAEGDLNVYIHDGYWIDVGTEERLDRANREWV